MKSKGHGHKEPDFVTRQRAEEEARLRALIETVSTRPRGLDRLPKKVGELIVDTGIKDGYHTRKATFVLRLDAKAGEFVVEHGDVLYVSRTREALQAKMDEVGKITLALAWTRYLQIKYVGLATRDRHEPWQESELGPGDRRTKRTQIRGLSLRWEVVEYTDEFTIPGQKPCRMRRTVDEQGRPSKSTDTVDHLPDGLVEYTPARLSVLHSIAKALAEADATMVELLSGAPRRVAARLDGLAEDQVPLLQGGQPRPDPDGR